MRQRGHVPSARRFRAAAVTELKKLVARQPKPTVEEINAFLRRFNRASGLSYEVPEVRTLLRQVGLRVVRKGTGWDVLVKKS